VQEHANATDLPVDQKLLFCLEMPLSDSAVAYSMGQIIKPVCDSQSASLSVHLCICTLTVAFLDRFHQNWHRRKNPPPK